MPGLTSRILRERSNGPISSMRMVRMTMSKLRCLRASMASSPKGTLVMRGAVERFS